MDEAQINMNKVYTFSTKFIIGALLMTLALGFTLGIMGTTSPETQKEEKISTPTPVPTRQPVRENTSPPSVEAGAFKQQVKDCQNLSKLQNQALELSTEVILITGSTILSIANGDIDVDQIEKDTARVNAINEEISQLTNEITPLTEKCFKQ